jgi:hypothetical protein
VTFTPEFTPLSVGGGALYDEGYTDIAQVSDVEWLEIETGIDTELYEIEARWINSREESVTSRTVSIPQGLGL